MPWELRFFNNKMDDYNKVENWFTSIDDKFATEERDDLYVYSPKSLDLGIKIRQERSKYKTTTSPSKVEIKWRKSRDIKATLVEGKVIGFLEEWIKWGWNTGPDESNDRKVDLFLDFPNGPLITIRKNRLLRRYVFDNNLARSTKYIKERAEGLSCEITKITSRNTNWWSIGFEEFGNKHCKEHFCHFIERILKDFSVRLEENNSCGYPEWISRNFNL